MDSILGSLFGDQDVDTKKTQAQDFISRYEDGHPADHISDEEALTNYQAVAAHLSPQDLEDSATEAYERLSPGERAEFAQWLKERGGTDLGGVNADDPRQLARVTSRLQQEQPEGLAGLLGGGGLGSLLGGAAGGGGIGSLLGGVLGGEGHGTQQSQGEGASNLLHNPIARAALGGIAAMAMRKIMNRR